MPFFYFPFFTTEITEPTEILYKKRGSFIGWFTLFHDKPKKL
jgi:hypothetical protein